MSTVVFDTYNLQEMLVGMVFLFLVEPVNVLRSLEDQTVNTIPGKAIFECEISNVNLPPEWKCGGKTLSSGDKYEMVSVNGIHTLIVKNVDGKDENDYTVDFKLVSSTAKLSIKGTLEMNISYYNILSYIVLI